MKKHFIIVTSQKPPISKDHLSQLKKSGQAKIYGPYTAEHILGFKQQGKLKPQTIIYIDGERYAEEFSIVYPQIVNDHQDDALGNPATNPAKTVPGASGAYKYHRQQESGVSRFSIFILLALLVAGAGFAYKQFFMKKEWSEIYADSKDAIVKINVGDSTGSGFFIGSDGLIITNSHVIDNDSEDELPIRVVVEGGREYNATVVKRGYEPLDLTLLRIKSRGHTTLGFVEKDACDIGEELVAIGAPLGLELSMTKGVVSSCERTIRGVDFIQTDTPINPGNSGGPLLNRDGKVIGVSTLKINMEGVDGLNFAIQAAVVDDFINHRLDDQNREFAKEYEKHYEERKKFREYLTRVYDDIYGIYRNEMQAYNFNLKRKVSKRRISSAEANKLIETKKRPPKGFENIEEWIKSLTKQFVNDELTEKQVSNIISRHFVDRS